jgi:hypothetical protein
MESPRRPVGVTLLSLLAFAVSPAWVFLLVGFLFTIFAKSELPPFSDQPAFLYACVLIPIALACFMAMAWISFTAALDLWKLRNRGRLLASVSMVLILLLGILYLLIQERWWTLAGVGLCVFSVSFLIYLQVPSIRRRFVAEPER